MTLVEVFPRWSWIPDLKAREKKSAIKEMLNHLVIEGRMKDDAARKAEKIVHKREIQGSTAIGKGLALPHAKGCTRLSRFPSCSAATSWGSWPFSARRSGSPTRTSST